MGLAALNPIIEVMARQMLFRDPPAHTRLRNLCAAAFTPARVAVLRGHIQDIADGLIDGFIGKGSADIVADLAAPMPAIVTAEMLGVPVSDHEKLKQWSIDFAEILGNFQHEPDRVARVAASVREMTEYFRAAIHQQETDPHEGLVNSLVRAQVDGVRLTEEEIIANCILTMIGGQETSTNLISSGLLTLLRHPRANAHASGRPVSYSFGRRRIAAVRKPNSAYGARRAGRLYARRQTYSARSDGGGGSGGRESRPGTLPRSGRTRCKRGDKGHLAFGWAAHFCFGAPLARIEGQIAFSTILRRLRI